MLRAMLRDLWGHRIRLMLTLLTIALGTGFVVTTWVAGDATATMLAGPPQRTDVDVIVDPADGGWLTVSDRDAVAAAAGGAIVSTIVRGYTAVAAHDGRFTTGWHERGGIGWRTTAALSLTAGRAPAGRYEVAVEKRTAAEGGLTVGARTFLRLDGERRHEAVVVGLFTFRPVGTEATPAAAFDEATAKTLLGERYDRIEVTAPAPQADPDALASAVSRALLDRRSQATAQTAEAATEDVQRMAERQAFKTRMSMLMLAAVSVLTSMYVIANTFTMLATGRIRQVALLRAVGAGRHQIRRAVLAEALVVGALGAAGGVAGGIAAAYFVVRGSALPSENVPFAVSPTAVLLGFATAITTTVTATLAVAWRASAVPPAGALRAGPVPVGKARHWRTATAAVLLAAGLVAVLGTASPDVSQAHTAVGLAGALAAWAGLLLFGPALATAVLRPLARIATRGPAEILTGLRNAVRDPRRTAGTAATMAIGLGLVCGMATFSATSTTALTSEIGNTVPAETVIVRATDMGATLAPDVVAVLRDVPGHTVVAPVRTGYGSIVSAEQQYPVRIAGLDPAAIGTVLRPMISAGKPDLANGVIVPDDDARTLGLQDGDHLQLRVGESVGSPVLTVSVVGVYEDNEALTGVLVSNATIAAALPDSYTSVYLQPVPARTAPSLRASVETALSGHPEASVTDGRELIGELTGATGDVLDALLLMLAVVIIIAILGVMNTLSLSITERRREIGVVRAIGASRSFVHRMIRWESLTVCLYGGLQGVVTGLSFGAVVQHLLLQRPLWQITVPWVQLTVILTGTIIVGLIAAAWPARRATRRGVLKELAME